MPLLSLALTVITLVSGLLLGLVNDITAGPIASQQAKEYLLRSYFSFLRASFSKSNRTGETLNLRYQQVAENNRIGNALCGSSENTENSGKNTKTDAIYILPLWCNGACNVVRRHKPCTKHKAMRKMVLASRKKK